MYFVSWWIKVLWLIPLLSNFISLFQAFNENVAMKWSTAKAHTQGVVDYLQNEPELWQRCGIVAVAAFAGFISGYKREFVSYLWSNPLSWAIMTHLELFVCFLKICLDDFILLWWKYILLLIESRLISSSSGSGLVKARNMLIGGGAATAICWPHQTVAATSKAYSAVRDPVRDMWQLYGMYKVWRISILIC